MPAPDLSEGVQRFAALSYLFLPLFLAAVAGICMLWATIRGTLTSGMAASFAGLGGVIVVGVAIVAAAEHKSRRRAAPVPVPAAAAAPAPAPAGPAAQETASKKEIEAQLERLDAENHRLRRVVRVLGTRGTGPGAEPALVRALLAALPEDAEVTDLDLRKDATQPIYELRLRGEIAAASENDAAASKDAVTRGLSELAASGRRLAITFAPPRPGASGKVRVSFTCEGTVAAPPVIITVPAPPPPPAQPEPPPAGDPEPK